MEIDTDIALWRYGLIAPLLHPDPLGRTQAERLREIAGRTYQRPDKKPVRLSSETLRRWLYRFQAGGLSALQDENRARDFSLGQDLRDRLFQLRRDQPRWSLAFLFDHLIQSRAWDGLNPSRSALYRFCHRHGLLRLKDSGETFRAFEFTLFGQLWIADFMHGPRVLDGAKKRKTYLHAIIDDATRYLVAARFHPAENTEAMVVDIRDAVRRFGIPQRFYSDNGAAFKSRHLKVIAARLAFQVPHSPPYRPQGRGKIERFFRTVRDRFLADCRAKTLADINRELEAWLATYHQTIHDGIGQTPLQKRLEVGVACRPLPEVTDLDPLFYQERHCMVSRTGLIRLHGREFEIQGHLPGTRVPIFFLPWEPEKAWYGLELKPARILNKHANATLFDEVPF
jgi:putative transposase